MNLSVIENSFKSIVEYIDINFSLLILASKSFIIELNSYESRVKEFSNESNDALDYAYNLFVKNVTHNINENGFNVAISDMMIFINACYNSKVLNKEYMHNFLTVLSCYAPHLAEELNEMMGYHDSIYNSV